MLGFVLRRLLLSVVVLFFASILVFVMVSNSGDPLSNLLSNPRHTAAQVAARRHELGLDRPLYRRYGTWLSHFVRGDFGRSLVNNQEVRPLVMSRLWVTMRLVIVATVIAVILAVGVGVISAVKQYSATDYTATFVGFLFLAMPVFWLGALLKEYVAIKVNGWVGHDILFTIGQGTPNLTGSQWHHFTDAAGHLVLPALTLVLISFAAWSRYQRSAMLDVLNSDFVRLARAKGLTPTRVITRHALRNALIPLATVVAIDFGAVFGGAVITEEVFEWHGMGELLINGVVASDINVVLAWLMVTAVVVILFNLIADVLYAVLDPRIRLA